MNSQQTASTRSSREDRYDFQKLLELVGSVDRFPIDFNIAWKWSGFQDKYKAKKVLFRSFTETEDFSIKLLPLQSQVNSKRLGNPGDPRIVKISIDCWKSLALMANTFRGRQLRRDILQCEAIIKLNNSRYSSNLSVHLEKAVQKNVTLQEILSRQWCNSLFKIMLALELLNCSTVEDVRDIYIEILTASCHQLLETFSSVEKMHSISEFENFQALQKVSNLKQHLIA